MVGLANGGGYSLWEDIRFLSNVRITGPTAPLVSVFRSPIYSYAFPAGLLRELFFSCQLPHSFELAAAGLAAHCHIHFSVNTVNTGTVKWGLDLIVADINGNFPAPVNFIQTYNIAANSQYKHMLLDVDDLDISGLGVSAIIKGRIYRDGTTDTFPDDAFLMESDAHVLLNTGGSKQEFSKT